LLINHSGFYGVWEGVEEDIKNGLCLVGKAFHFISQVALIQ